MQYGICLKFRKCVIFLSFFCITGDPEPVSLNISQFVTAMRARIHLLRRGHPGMNATKANYKLPLFSLEIIN